MLSNITALVTGASQGIGAEIAETFADHGANVTLAARSDGIYETAERIDDDQGLPVETDVTDEASVEAAVEETVDAFGGLDCVVNNAGVAGPVQPFDRVDPEEFLHVQNVNVAGPLVCAKHAAPHLRESDRGSVVNIGSIGGKRPYPNRTPYAASKMALIGLTRTLSYELGRDDVTVNTVLPGPVEGPRIEDVVAKQAELADVEDAEPASIGPDDFALPDYTIPPEDVAEQVAYLAGPHARKITGQEIAVDAGGTPF
ncbi:SDR family oxidoreductase [Natronomonas salina]|uniref:SDR family NAD(P)-dependent oxidoreductase n=1 Tax=Natronomonas salina TaxID=1710540 RepID=UPI0015B71FA9|nr:SDR family oxidoreductase [Natronomonas salina]QLD87854.1 SDR family oxidoreductase [Natronomonas salina]